MKLQQVQGKSIKELPKFRHRERKSVLNLLRAPIRQLKAEIQRTKRERERLVNEFLVLKGQADEVMAALGRDITPADDAAAARVADDLMRVERELKELDEWVEQLRVVMSNRSSNTQWMKLR